jgi:gluconolactonase
MKKLPWHLLWVVLAITVVSSLAVSQTAQAPSSSGSSDDIVKMDPGLDTILAPGTKLEMLKAEGFDGGEGPVWVKEGKGGYLLFSSGAKNRIYEWKPSCFKYPCPTDAGTLSVYMEHAGYKDPSMVGTTDPKTGMPLHGTNGLYLDLQGRLLIDANGDRAVERVEKDGSRTVLADRYEGKQIGCPNDIVVKSDGGIYFTDSGGGCIPGGENGPNWQLKEHGVYLIKDGMLTMLDHDPNDAPPNGIVLSPDGKTLYVTNAPKRRDIFAYDVQPDDTVKNRRIFADLSGEKGLGGPDGTKVDKKGNFYTAATGGLWIFTPDGKRLGKVPAPEGIRFANLAFGDPDGKTLYIVSAKNLYRIRVKIPGVRPE